MSYLPREERRRSIIDAAARVIASDGISAVNSRTVSGVLGGSPGQIHHHFASIDQLISEAWKRYAKNEVRDFRTHVARMDREDALREFFADVLDDPRGGTSLARWAEASTQARIRAGFAPAFIETLEILIEVLEGCLGHTSRDTAAGLLTMALGFAGLPPGAPEKLKFSGATVMSSAIADAISL
ncbi:AcrR family transcriptional regulator [Microbacterium resistens]|uniref:AcrR family transcriptional regulator n=1 Tax=Microbacterium resistens TaxID=156977 RepID=A0ABU1SCS4_9MICO|nr:TetR family transcriptional regulator [Microbacterium resistens]MDR6867404.1 AcrR family transcriptional regulator [Microbacterium resistens]